MNNKKFAAYFGFTEAEVRQMLRDYGISQHVFTELKDWYDGYYFTDIDIYNPWSILNAIRGIKPTMTCMTIQPGYGGFCATPDT